jgi:hypothetical protein
MENKQTAVKWLVEQLRQLAHNPKTHIAMGDIRVTQGLLDELEEQAKPMEKEQLEKELISFFLFIRNSGEHFIGMSIEQFVKYYLEKK